MPQELAPSPDHGGVIRHRNELIASTAGETLRMSGHTEFCFRVSNVPLFREVQGELQQAIRLRIAAGEVGVPLTARIGNGSAWLDEVEIASGVTSTDYLFVPEVTAETAFTVEIQGNRETIATFSDFRVTPQRKWTIHLVHHSHYDIGYTDPQSTVLAAQLDFIDEALDLATLTDDWPEPARFRWSIETNWPLRHWLRTRSKARRDELVRRVHEGRIEVNALPFSMHTEAYSFDELARQLEFAQELRDTLGIEITTAMQTDVPGSTVGLSSLLTDAGVEFLAVAHNYAGRSIPHRLDGQELTRPFHWQAPDGQKVMVWYTDTLHGSAYMEAMTIGFGDSFGQVAMSLPEYLNALAQRNYPYGTSDDWIAGSLSGVEDLRGGYPHDVLHMRVQGAFGDNGPASMLPASIVREWNEQYAWPKLVSSTNRAFCDDAKARLGDRIDTFSGDWTDWWADGIGSSAAVLGKNRASQAAIRTGQTLNALAVGLGDEPIPTEATEVRTAYEEMALFDEHTWGAGNPWNKRAELFDSGEHQWIRKASFAYAAEERVETLLRGGIDRLGRVAVASSAEGDPLAVFNPNSWARTDLVRVFVPQYAWPDRDATLVERDSGRAIPFVVEPQVHPRHRPLGQWLHFLAEDVPPLGYIRYAFIAGEASGQAAETGDPCRIETAHLGVSLDLERAVIASLRDLANERELVDADAPFGFGAYIHDRYASGTGFNHLSSRIGRADPWLLGARGTGQFGVVTSRISSDVFERVTYRQSAQGADWIETTLTLPHGAPRLHITNRLFKPALMDKESVYFAFPFAGADPRLTFEITGGVASPESPHVPGSARHFRAIRHWATVETGEAPPVAWATTQAPLLQVGNIHLPYAPFPTTIPADQASPGTIYSWALNNIWDTNFPAQQGGEIIFDYVVAIGGKDAAALGRDTGAAGAQPLIGLRARPGDAPVETPERGSFVTVDDPRIEVVHLSSGVDGTIVANVESHTDEPVTTRLTFAGLTVESAEAATFLGTNAQPVDVTGNGVTVEVAPRALQTVRLTV